MNYDHFAETFSKSRQHHPWPELDYLIDIMEKSGVKSVLDIGCGNGRFLEHYGEIQNHSPLSLRDIPPQEGGQVDGYPVSDPPLGGGKGGVFSVQDGQGYHHRLPYHRESTEKAKNLRKNMTEPEKKLWYQYLREQDSRWHRQYPIDHYIVDFYCPDRKIVLEIDGESHIGNEEYDSLRTQTLAQYGVQVIRFTNQDIMMRFEGVCEIIKMIIEKTPPCHSVTSPLKEDDTTPLCHSVTSPLKEDDTTPPCHSVTSPLKEGGKREFTYLGIDNSSGMIEEARKLHPGHDFAVCDMLSLQSLKHSNLSTFQSILLLASFHHLETHEARLGVLRDMRPLLREGGRVYMTNWNLREQPRYATSHRGDGDYDIKIGAYSRYYHGFTLDELEELFRAAGYTTGENRIFEGGRNIVSILE